MSFSIANKPHRRGYCANDIAFLPQSRDRLEPVRCVLFTFVSYGTARSVVITAVAAHVVINGRARGVRRRTHPQRTGPIRPRIRQVRLSRVAAETVECTPGNAAVASSVNRPRFVRRNTTVLNTNGSPLAAASALTRTGCCVCLFAVRKSSTTSFCTVPPCTHRRQFGFVFEFPLQVASRCTRTFRLTAPAVSKTLGPHPAWYSVFGGGGGRSASERRYDNDNVSNYCFLRSRNDPPKVHVQTMYACHRSSRWVAIAIFGVLLSVSLTSVNATGLYEESDLMEILDNNNFHQKVVEGNTSYVVEFYNAFCGHCIRFSTPWKEFGVEVYGKQLFFL